MSRLDDELKIALQRKEAPPDFADRVLARIAELPPSPSRWKNFLALFQLPAMRFAAVGAAACLVVALTIGVQQYQKYQEMKRDAGIAKAQVMLAFQIASAKLNVARQRVNRITERAAAQDSADNSAGANQNATEAVTKARSKKKQSQ